MRLLNNLPKRHIISQHISFFNLGKNQIMEAFTQVQENRLGKNLKIQRFAQAPSIFLGQIVKNS
jgi:hypothetical protein